MSIDKFEKFPKPAGVKRTGWGQPPLTEQQREAHRDRILTAAVAVAQTHGYAGLLRDTVAAKAGVAAGQINRYFGTMDALRVAVMERAVDNRLLTVIAQGLAHENPVALAAPIELRAAAVASVGGDL